MTSTVVTKMVNIEGISQMLCVEVAPGEWCWTTPGHAWKWCERVPPPAANFGLMTGDRYIFQMRTASLESAIGYAVGFSYGYKNGYQHGQDDERGADDMARQIKEEAEKKATLNAPTREEKA